MRSDHLVAEETEQPTSTARAHVTATWLDEQRRLQMAYADSRAAWTQAWYRGRKPEPPTETERRSRSGTVFDRRQYRFDF